MNINKIEKWIKTTVLLEELGIEKFSTQQLYAELGEFYEKNFNIIEIDLTEHFNQYEKMMEY